MKTLIDLLECFQLYAVCEPCQRMENVDIENLIEALGEDYPIDRVRMRLLCNQCRQRTHSVRIVYVGPEGKAATFRYAR